MSKKLQSVLTFFVALSLVMGSLALTACGNSSSSSAQDNCYGEDMPVINEE